MIRFGLALLAFIAGLIPGPANADRDAAVAAWTAGDWEGARAACVEEASARDPGCMHMIGMLLLSGRGVQKSEAEGAAWIRDAAELGFPNALVDYGWLLAQGSGVAQDFAAAAEWYRKAAEAGSVEGQYHLARVFWLGQGVEEDLSKAETLARAAANQGHREAQFLLGQMYWDGVQGIERNRMEARRWMSAAAAQSHPEAADQLEDERWLIWKLVITAVVVGLITGWAAWLTLARWQRARASRSWPTASGRVVSSALDTQTVRGGTFYYPDVSYEYEVGGRNWRASGIRFGGYPAGAQDVAERELARYPVGASVEVIYDPGRPEIAALERRANAFMPATIAIIAGLVFLVVLTALLDEAFAIAGVG